MFSPTPSLQPDDILGSLQRHPRVAYQQLLASDAALAQLKASLHPLLAFGGGTYQGLIAVLDWDHRLPSKTVLLRLFAYYAQITLISGMGEFQARTQQILARDHYPEFDVPDYYGLPADESYEAEVALSGEGGAMRLVSGWRRDIGPLDARRSVRIAHDSAEFKRIATETRGQRPEHLGGLEAVAWTPPCESGFSSWTIDVWYLTHLDASIGKGQSLLVDLERQQVVGVREFVVRAG